MLLLEVKLVVVAGDVEPLAIARVALTNALLVALCADLVVAGFVLESGLQGRSSTTC